MTPQQIQLVRSSFAQVAPIAPQAAALFYRHLFAADEAVARLFKGDMAVQGDKLMRMLGTAVALLDQPQQLMPVLHRLGERHAGYGVLPRHYDTVGAALLRTLAEGLGEAFTEEVCDAWCELYGLVSRTMLAAAVLAERDEAVVVG
jgi:hemoglobin-like flavoprotein